MSTRVLAWVATGLLLCGILPGCDRTDRSISDLRSNDPARQIPAAKWLAEHPTRAAVDVLRFGMESNDLAVRAASATAIGATGDARAMAHASRILRADALSADRTMAEVALEGMRGVGGAALPDLVTVAILTTDQYLQLLVRASIAEILTTATDTQRRAGAAAIVDGVEETDPDLYRAAYAILVTFAPLASTELVDLGLAHHSRRIQLTIMMGMSDASCLAAAPAIEAFLYDADSVLRLEAARSLGSIGGPNVVSALEEVAASDPVLDVRRAARQAIAAIAAAPQSALEDGE